MLPWVTLGSVGYTEKWCFWMREGVSQFQAHHVALEVVIRADIFGQIMLSRIFPFLNSDTEKEDY